MTLRQTKILLCTLALIFLQVASHAKVVSFERVSELGVWNIDKGKLSISNMRYKFGSSSMKVDWAPGARLTMDYAPGLYEASQSKAGGVTMWVYGEGGQPAELQFVFLTSEDKELCRIPFRIGYTGWRALWSKFYLDMGKKTDEVIGKMVVVFPETSGTLYVDMLEFKPSVPWTYMEDFQISNTRDNFAMVPDIMTYRTAELPQDKIDATDEEIALIETRLRNWCLGTGQYSKDKWVRSRIEAENEFIASGLALAAAIPIEYNDDGTPVGYPLFSLDSPKVVEDIEVKQFREINENILIPLALDWCKNGNKASLDKAMFIYDWFNDQGWADGSSLGTIVLEKLRSTGYLYSYFLLKDQLPAPMLEKQRNAMRWYTLFGHCYAPDPFNGANTDDLRALANPKLIYALSIEDPHERRIALTAFKRYMDRAMSIAPGALDVIKDDFSGYHHRTAYNNGYYPTALYTVTQLAWILHGTPYALSDEVMSNVIKALKTFHFFCAGIDIPAGTVGRFPLHTRVLHRMLPSYAYMILADEGADQELIEIFNDILAKSSKEESWSSYVNKAAAAISYTNTVGEMEALAEAVSMIPKSLLKKPAQMKTGALFMPYSGLHVAKDNDVHFNVKGFSKYIWDFEGAASGLNKYGRWTSNGHLEFFDFRNGNKSFHPNKKQYNWNHIQGTTSKVLPLQQLQSNQESKTDHRNYSSESFLAGVHGADNVSSFSVRLHDAYLDTSFRADKSFFFFDDVVACLGSGIFCKDSQNKVATTMFQDFLQSGKQRSEDVYEDASFLYIVKEGSVNFSTKEKYSLAYIDHGVAPEGAGYEYYIVKNKAAADALEKRPIDVLRKDKAGHVIRRDNVVCASVFEAGVDFDGLAVRQVNVPLAYILEDKGSGQISLSLCEPDMRRPWARNMNYLTHAMVIEDAKPFDTELLLDGKYELVSGPEDVVLEYQGGMTKVRLTTIHARNYKINLKYINN